MKTISKWDDLAEFGIVPLTSESCGLMYRILCDTTDKGRKIIQKCLGFPDISLAANWNRGSEKEPHTGSIMLSPEMIGPLAVFALLENGCLEVWLKDGTAIGIERTDDREVCVAWIKEWLGTVRMRRLAYQGTMGDRNLHMMSGRVT